jgi:glucose 1-dehydrogenase
MQRLTGKVALITGASRGVGRGTAICLAEEGADVLVNYRTHPDEAKEVVDAVTALGRRALAWQADVADRAQVERMVQATVEHFGHLDIAVANAAYSVRQPLLTAEWEGVKRTVDVTMFGVFHTCQFAARQMVAQKHGGKIIIISSRVSDMVYGDAPIYSMCKAAIDQMGRLLSSELAPHHINVNVIKPGWTDTPGERAFFSEAELERGGQVIPWGRLGTGRDIGKCVAYLASDDADYVTGAAIPVDGGYLGGMRLPAEER